MIYIQRERLRYSAIIYSAAKLSKLIIISSIISYKYVRFYGKRRPIGTNQTYFAYHNSILKCVGGGDKRGKRIGGEEDSLSSRCSVRSNSCASSRLWIKTSLSSRFSIGSNSRASSVAVDKGSLFCYSV